jgi:hypothetical protein
VNGEKENSMKNVLESHILKVGGIEICDFRGLKIFKEIKKVYFD